jgi:pimeloyl-ACP methyl ester carboxylesterase
MNAQTPFPARPDIVTAADGTALHVSDLPGARPVVFLHGWGLSSEMWAYQRLHLSDLGFRCVAYDRRGHGRSSDPGTGYDYDTLADDLAAVLAARDLCDVTLVGLSMAAGEMVRYLTRHGTARVSRLAYVAPAGTPFTPRAPDDPGGIDPAMFEGFRRHVLMRDVPGWLDENAGPFFDADTSPGMVAWIKGLMLQASPKALVECNRSLVETDFRPELPRIALPTLVVHGTHDASAPLEMNGRPTAEAIPGARLEVYEGAPHGLFITHMDRLNADLAAFAGGA